MNDATNDEKASKDWFFEQLGRLSEAMSAAHGRDFAMGALVLAARYLAEGVTRARVQAAAEAGSGAFTPPVADPRDLQ